MSILDRTIRELLTEGTRIVLISESGLTRYFSRETLEYNSDVDEDSEDSGDDVPPYPLQPWMRRRIADALNEAGEGSHWSVRQFVASPGHEPVNPIGRRVKSGWNLYYFSNELVPGPARRFDIYMGDRMLMAARENFPGRIEDPS